MAIDLDGAFRRRTELLRRSAAVRRGHHWAVRGAPDAVKPELEALLERIAQPLRSPSDAKRRIDDLAAYRVATEVAWVARSSHRRRRRVRLIVASIVVSVLAAGGIGIARTEPPVYTERFEEEWTPVHQSGHEQDVHCTLISRSGARGSLDHYDCRDDWSE